MVRNKEQYNEYMRGYMIKRYHERRNKAIAYLGGVCSRCGSDVNLEFDHVDRRGKSFGISKLWSVTEKAFWDEVNKCQLLCHECHIEKGFEAGDFNGPRSTHGTLNMYNKRKCRCDMCKAAKAKSNKEQRIRRKAA